MAKKRTPPRPLRAYESHADAPPEERARLAQLFAGGPTQEVMFRRTLAEMTGHELKVVRRDAEHGRKLSGRRKGATSTLTRKITDYLDRHPRATPHGLLAASEKISKP